MFSYDFIWLSTEELGSDYRAQSANWKISGFFSNILTGVAHSDTIMHWKDTTILYYSTGIPGAKLYYVLFYRDCLTRLDLKGVSLDRSWSVELTDDTNNKILSFPLYFLFNFEKG